LPLERAWGTDCGVQTKSAHHYHAGPRVLSASVKLLQLHASSQCHTHTHTHALFFFVPPLRASLTLSRDDMGCLPYTQRLRGEGQGRAAVVVVVCCGWCQGVGAAGLPSSLCSIYHGNTAAITFADLLLRRPRHATWCWLLAARCHLSHSLALDASLLRSSPACSRWSAPSCYVPRPWPLSLCPGLSQRTPSLSPPLSLLPHRTAPVAASLEPSLQHLPSSTWTWTWSLALRLRLAFVCDLDSTPPCLLAACCRTYLVRWPSSKSSKSSKFRSGPPAHVAPPPRPWEMATARSSSSSSSSSSLSPSSSSSS